MIVLIISQESYSRRLFGVIENVINIIFSITVVFNYIQFIMVVYKNS